MKGPKGICDRRCIPHGVMLHFKDATCINFRAECFTIPCHDPDCPKHEKRGEGIKKKYTTFSKSDRIGVQQTLNFIRQVVAGRCDTLDLEEIRKAIDRCLDE
jgi:hypothetical protein